MNNSPMISVIMPVYNGGEFLKEAIESILNQTYRDFEFIIAYDESSDDSLENIKEYQNIDSRIILSTGCGRGLVKSLNDAIDIARGEYIARMDADDISLPERFEKQIHLMKKENLDICGCHYLIINKDGKYIDTILTPLEKNTLLLYLAIGVPFAHGSVMFRKDFMSNNNLEYGQGVKFSEDKGLWIAMYKNSAKFSNVNDILFKYREFNQSLSKQRKKEVRIDDECLKDNILKFYDKEAYYIVHFLSSNIEKLNYREVEYLADIILYLSFKKFKLSYLKFFKNIPSRYKIISLFKFLLLKAF
jgi:glycosyltransferase involved in cell wall biosynthesis